MVRPRGARGFCRRWLMRSCINVFGFRLEHVLRAIMDISAHAIFLAVRPRWAHSGHQGSHAPGRPVLHRRLILSQNSAGKVGDYVIDSLLRLPIAATIALEI